uniref:Uncharacterized protein n=1 Tax=Romanomermis culicivorax TaxID=13658 RepID=A0A915IGE2_ROMCU
MMRVNGRQTIFRQLIFDDLYQFFHTIIVIGPIANDLYITNFVNGSQIRMSVGESRINLDGSVVTSRGALYVAHLFQSVAHVGIGVGECRRNANGLPIMGYSFGQATLLL